MAQAASAALQRQPDLQCIGRRSHPAAD